MAKATTHNNLVIWVIVALLVGGLIGYQIAASKAPTPTYMNQSGSMMKDNGSYMMQSGKMMRENGMMMQNMGKNMGDNEFTQKGKMMEEEGMMMEQKGSGMMDSGSGMMQMMRN